MLTDHVEDLAPGGCRSGHLVWRLESIGTQVDQLPPESIRFEWRCTADDACVLRVRIELSRDVNPVPSVDESHDVDLGVDRRGEGAECPAQREGDEGLVFIELRDVR